MSGAECRALGTSSIAVLVRLRTTLRVPPCAARRLPPLPGLPVAARAAEPRGAHVPPLGTRHGHLAVLHTGEGREEGREGDLWVAGLHTFAGPVPIGRSMRRGCVSGVLSVGCRKRSQ
jgi:hypothetical protein